MLNLTLRAALLLTILFGFAVIHTNWFDDKPRELQIQLISGLQPSFAPDYYIDAKEYVSIPNKQYGR